MFFIYLRRELRRRMRQVIFISLGLAIGIGLVITVTAASAGVAQRKEVCSDESSGSAFFGTLITKACSSKSPFFAR